MKVKLDSRPQEKAEKVLLAEQRDLVKTDLSLEDR